MELRRAITARRMVRNLSPEPLDGDEVDALLDLARRAPSAGNTQAVEFVVLDDPEATARYWDTTLPVPRRTTFRWTGLLDAPTLVLVLTSPAAYVRRYGEDDKGRAATLGAEVDAWAVPYWWVDAGAVAQNLLLLATEAGLGACLFGVFDHEEAVCETFGIPADRRIVATIALGRPLDDEPGRSRSRPRPPLEQIRFRGRYRGHDRSS